MGKVQNQQSAPKKKKRQMHGTHNSIDCDKKYIEKKEAKGGGSMESKAKDGASHPPRTGRPDLRSRPSHRIASSEPKMSDPVSAMLCAPPSQHLCPQAWDDVGHRYEARRRVAGRARRYAGRVQRNAPVWYQTKLRRLKGFVLVQARNAHGVGVETVQAAVVTRNGPRAAFDRIRRWFRSCCTRVTRSRRACAVREDIRSSCGARCEG